MVVDGNFVLKVVKMVDEAGIVHFRVKLALMCCPCSICDTSSLLLMGERVMCVMQSDKSTAGQTAYLV